jgi:hypothetical protein
MAECTVLPYPRSKRKTNAPTAETEECGFCESAFLADRGCFAFITRDESQETHVQTSAKGIESSTVILGLKAFSVQAFVEKYVGKKCGVVSAAGDFRPTFVLPVIRSESRRCRSVVGRTSGERPLTSSPSVDRSAQSADRRTRMANRS